jgi:hypothetical protein
MLLWRDWSAILKIDAPRAAALVRKPERSECPANWLRVEASALGVRFDDGGDAAIGQPRCLYAPALGDRPVRDAEIFKDHAGMGLL